MKRNLKKLLDINLKLLTFILWLIVFYEVFRYFQTNMAKAIIVIWGVLIVVNTAVKIKRMYFIKKDSSRQEKEAVQGKIIFPVAKLNEEQFKDGIIHMFSRCDCSIVLTKKQEHIILETENSKQNIILCYKNTPVTQELIEKTIKNVKIHPKESCVLISNQEFTDQAKCYGKLQGIMLISGNKIQSLLQESSITYENILKTERIAYQDI